MRIRIIIALSLAGSLLCLCRLIITYLVMAHTIRQYKSVETNHIYDLLTQVKETYSCAKPFRVVYSPQSVTPYLFGLFCPTIVVPEVLLSDSEWRCIFQHELYHYCHHHLWLRLACEGLRVLCWWNPLVYFLRRRMISLQEYAADQSVIRHMNELQRLDYAQNLVNTAKTVGNLQAKPRIMALLQPAETWIKKERRQFLYFTCTAALSLSTVFLPGIFLREPHKEFSQKTTEPIISNNYTAAHSDAKTHQTQIIYTEANSYVYVYDEVNGSMTIYAMAEAPAQLRTPQ